MDILTQDEGLQMVLGDLEIPDRLLGREWVLALRTTRPVRIDRRLLRLHISSHIARRSPQNNTPDRLR
jgi:hypothetical protein